MLTINVMCMYADNYLINEKKVVQVDLWAFMCLLIWERNFSRRA